MVSRGAGHLLAAAAAGRKRPRSACSRTGSPSWTPIAAEEIAQTAGGPPFPMIEMARARVSGSGTVSALLPPDALRTFQRVALLGQTFSTDELLAISDGSEDETYDQLELALAALVVEPAEAGFRFRHPARPREGLVREVPPHERSRGHQRVAEALAAARPPPRQVAHHYLAAGLASRAVPYAVQAVEIAGALGAYRDALTLVDGVREHAGPDHLPVLLSRRGDLLMALGEPGAVEAYTEAARITTGTLHRLVRARLARAAAVGGDLDTARSALAGLDLEDDEADASLLLAQGNAGVLHRRHGDRPEGGGRGPRAAPRDRRPVAGGRPRGTARPAGPPSRGVVPQLPRPSCVGPRGTSVWPAPCSTRTCAWRRTCSTAASPTPRSSPRQSSSGCAPARPVRCEAWPSPPP